MDKERMKTFRKILIANRGEIAVRIAKTCRQMGLACGAICADEELTALHAKVVDEVFPLGSGTLKNTYLNMERIVKIACENGYDAVHPGYGFLSENPRFARACEESGVTFIGPRAQIMEVMGDKIASKDLATKAGVPVLRSIVGTPDELTKNASQYEFPVLIKAAAGGGGKGMRIVKDPKKLPEMLVSTSREAKSYFGDERIFIEKYIENPRHMEVQVLADHHGNRVALFERECSLQRRHQKVIEEAPSPTLSPEKRQEIMDAALRLVESAEYTNAGTIEFLVEQDLSFYFLEMNTRIQVEHAVTEMITGLDLVEEQIRIARGEKLKFSQKELEIKGHAIECRVYAEDPANNFFPSPGKIHFYQEPTGENVRVDSALAGVGEIGEAYDPMIAKLITWGEDRQQAIEKMGDALKEYHIHGITTNKEFLYALVRSEAFSNNNISTHFIEENLAGIIAGSLAGRKEADVCVLAAAIFFFAHFNAQKKNVWEEIGFWRNCPAWTLEMENQDVSVSFQKVSRTEVRLSASGGSVRSFRLISCLGHKVALAEESKTVPMWVSRDSKNRYIVSTEGVTYRVDRKDNLRSRTWKKEKNDQMFRQNGSLAAPMPGKVVEISVKEGQPVEKDQKLLVLEAMKMENHIVAPFSGKVEKIWVKPNDKVEAGNQLISLIEKKPSEG